MKTFKLRFNLFIKKFFPILIMLFIVFAIFTVCGCDKVPPFEPENDFTEKTYVALGDSITYGVDGMNGGKRMKYPYPEIVKRQLKLKKVINYGISGSTVTADTEGSYEPMSVRFSAMEDADIISVLGGVNDFMKNIPLGSPEDESCKTIYGALNVLCDGLCKKYPDSFIFFMTPFKVINREETSLGYSLEDVANAIKYVCEIYKLPVLDLYNYGQFELEAENEKSDKLHPSQQFFMDYTSTQISQFIDDNFS